MNQLTTEDLTSWLDDGEDHLLIDVLPHDHFEQKHIPGARNVPVDEPDFAARVLQLADGDKKRKVVVYCTNVACPASPKAASKLEQAGFRRVYDYGDGIEGYAGSGRPVAGATSAG
jgi:rhodanese-related sulfurtransferase